MLIALLLVIAPALGMSDCPEDDILLPDENYKITLTDIDGVETVGGFVTFECQTYISATRGSTTIFIPFDRIKTIEMQDNDTVITQESPEIDMVITLVDGSQYRSRTMSHQHITGEAEFGKFKIRMDHIRKIEFHLPPESTDSSDASEPPGDVSGNAVPDVPAD